MAAAGDRAAGGVNDGVGRLLVSCTDRPGIVDNAKLVRISMKIGLGESARFLRAHRAWLRRLVTRTFTPDPLMRRLRADDVAGLHFFTFNELERTERWRQRTLVHA